jgi:hypothetical protein
MNKPCVARRTGSIVIGKKFDAGALSTALKARHLAN